MKKIALLLIALLAPLPSWAFEVGAHREDVTPSLNRPVWIAGFQPKRPASGIHDKLWARSIVFSHRGEVVALCAVDCIGILHYDLWEVRKKVAWALKISPTCIVISSTHTHSGPDTLGIWGGSLVKTGKDPSYMKRLKEKIFRSLVMAYKNRRTARLRSGQTVVSSVLKDSRAPKIMDPVVTALQAVDEKGKTIASLVNYAMHPEVLTGGNPLLTSDYAHYLRETVEKTLGGICVFTVGSVGGMQTPRARSRTFVECKRIGDLLGQGALQALSQSKFKKVGTLEIETRRVYFPLTNSKFILGAFLGLLGDDMKRELTKQNRFLPIWDVPSDVSVIRIGKIQIGTMPGEAFPELGLVLKKWMRGRHCFLIGLANSENGYIFSPSQWTPRGYEETMSLGPDTAPIMMEALKGLIERSNGRMGK